MGSRARLVAVLALLVSSVTATSATAVTDDEPPVCAPVTLADLFPDHPWVIANYPPEPPGDPEPGVDGGQVDTSPDAGCEPFTYELVFPVAGGAGVGSRFGDDRDGGERLHQGVDLFAPKLTPVVAIADGTVIWTGRERCCNVGIRHADGWTSYYIHLNNDRYGSDDGRGTGIRPGLQVGDRVEAGQVIGWVGDSGNAEDTPSHLHFELRDPDGVPVDPLPSLQAALEEPEWPGMGTGDSLHGPFVDTDGTALPVAAALVSLGVEASCDDYGLRFCPDVDATGADAAHWIAALAGGPIRPGLVAYGRADREPSPAGSLDDLRGCSTRFCADGTVTRGEAAALVLSAFGRSSTPAAASRALYLRGATDACTPRLPDAGHVLTRVELARLVLRAVGQLPTPPCTRIS